MASNRYGIIRHGSIRDCKLKFPSPQARQDFAKKFGEYHASHDHDGDPPTYENVSASIVAPAGLRVHDIDDVTIDGWNAYEIEEYHEDRDRTYVNYEPPTCCVAPTLSLKREFIPSDAFQRHELSAIFGDMPDPDYTSLLESVERDGFIENVIKLLGGEILDGWHRYRAAKELNLLRKLRFQVWNPDKDRDGDPKAFVFARNIERRHYSAFQRAQIAVTFNERFGHGGDRSESNVPDGTLKTRKELAEQANVGERTISRAVAVEKAGQSKAVIAGEKTASEVLLEENRKKAHARAEKERRALWEAYGDERFGDEDDPEGFAIAASKAIGVSEMEGRFIYEAGKDEIDELSLETAEMWGQRFRLIRRDIEAGVAWVVAYQAGSTKREANRLLKALWEQVNAAIPKWKEKREGVGHASKTMLLQATLKFHSLPHDSETNVDILKKLSHLLSASTTDILEIFVRKQLRGESLWKTEETATVKELWEQVSDAMETWKQRHTTHVTNLTRVTKAHLIKAYRYCYGDRNREGEATAEELCGVLESLTQGHMPLILGAEQAWRNSQNSEQIEPETSNPEELEAFLKAHYQSHSNWDGLSIDELSEAYNCAPSVIYTVMKKVSEGMSPREDEGDNFDPDTAGALEKFQNQKHELYTLINETPLVDVEDEFGNANTDKATHKVMLAAHKAYDLSEDLLWSDQAIEALPADEIRKITGKYFLMVQDFAAPRADWVASLYQKVKDVSEDEGSDAESRDKVITRIIVYYDDPNSKERPSERHVEFSEGPVADKKLDALPLMVRVMLAEEIKDVR